MIILIVGPLAIFGILQQGDSDIRIETQPHPLAQIPPADTLPGSDIEYIDVDDLRFRINLFAFTYRYHNGNKGTSARLDIIIINNGTTVIDDLCFCRMTIYWADGSANFTTGFTSTSNYSLAAGSSLSISLHDSHDWTGIPVDLCQSGGYIYGRILISYNSTSTRILTTALVFIVHVVE